jgi:hypothetical protein
VKVVYVAGPFRGPSAWHVAENVRAAERVAFKVWEAGAAAICPHANTAHFDGALPDHVWLDGDLALLDRCDALVTVPGWQASTGARAEVARAQARGLPVFHDLPMLRYWLQEPGGPHLPDATGEPG